MFKRGFALQNLNEIQTVFIFNDEVERNADSVRKEVVCQ